MTIWRPGTAPTRSENEPLCGNAAITTFPGIGKTLAAHVANGCSIGIAGLSGARTFGRPQRGGCLP